LRQSSREYRTKDCTKISFDLANSKSLILLVAVECSGLLKMLTVFLDIVLHPEHHFYKPLTEFNRMNRMNRYNVGQNDSKMIHLEHHVITIQK
jgi:hypothetical protein